MWLAHKFLLEGWEITVKPQSARWPWWRFDTREPGKLTRVK